MAMTQASDYASQIQAALADRVVMESADEGVLLPHVNMYSLAGMKGKDSLTLHRWDDPGDATAGTEGTAFTDLMTLSMTGSTLTPSEQAIAQALVSNDAIEERTGIVSVQELFQTQPVETVMAALAPEIGLLARAVGRKREQDLTGLLASLNGGTTFGTTTADLTLALWLAGLLLLENKEGLPHEDYISYLDREAFGNLRDDVITSNYPSGVVTLDSASFVAARPDVSARGLQGVAFGVPIVRGTITARQTANSGADVVSAFMLRGVGAPEIEGGGQLGTFAFVEKRPLIIGIDTSLQERGVLLQANHKYVIGERVDEWGIPGVSDAP